MVQTTKQNARPVRLKRDRKARKRQKKLDRLAKQREAIAAQQQAQLQAMEAEQARTLAQQQSQRDAMQTQQQARMAEIKARGEASRSVARFGCGGGSCNAERSVNQAPTARQNQATKRSGWGTNDKRWLAHWLREPGHRFWHKSFGVTNGISRTVLPALSVGSRSLPRSRTRCRTADDSVSNSRDERADGTPQRVVCRAVEWHWRTRMPKPGKPHVAGIAAADAAVLSLLA